MILIKKGPFTSEEIKDLSEELETYIKTVIDIEKKICSAGGRLHADNEKVLLESGSKQIYLWGGGIDLETLSIDNNAIINIRPSQGNMSNEIQDPEARKRFEDLSRYFFRELWIK